MITLERRTAIQRYIVNYLLARATNNVVTLHTKEVEKEIIPEGLGSLSVSRYLRAMRQQGLIMYGDPRRHNHFYIIVIEPKLYEWLEVK
jgi:hypothetical protein